MTTSRVRAIVLRRTNYGEADRILQVLTPEGRMSVMAKGVRREKSKLAGGIELFAVSDIVVSRGRGELGILTSARLVQFYRHIMEDYDRLQFGYEAIRLVASATETIDESEWFDVLQEVFMGLDAVTIPKQLVEAWFYLHYATLLGRELSLVNDVDGQRISAEETYTYDVSEQGLRLARNGELTADHIKFLRLLNSKSLKVLAQVGGIGGVLPQCWSVARQHAAV
ncbi:MAG TPA: DNA repair protein RecO [Candidatus Saccharimonadales bacterium]